jgi:hypothetical protein
MEASNIPRKLTEKMEYWTMKVEIADELHDVLYGIEHENGKVVGILIKNITTEKVCSLTCFELSGLLEVLYNEKFSIKDVRENIKPNEILKCVQ